MHLSDEMDLHESLCTSTPLCIAKVSSAGEQYSDTRCYDVGGMSSFCCPYLAYLIQGRQKNFKIAKENARAMKALPPYGVEP